MSLERGATSEKVIAREVNLLEIKVAVMDEVRSRQGTLQLRSTSASDVHILG